MKWDEHSGNNDTTASEYAAATNVALAQRKATNRSSNKGGACAMEGNESQQPQKLRLRKGRQQIAAATKVALAQRKATNRSNHKVALAQRKVTNHSNHKSGACTSTSDQVGSGWAVRGS